MKKVWFRNFAIAMGLMGATQALGQYPAYNTNTGPSSYPVQQPGPGSYQLTNWQDTLPSVPAPPQGQYSNLAAPSAVHSGNGQIGHAPVEPIPMAQQYAPASPAPSVYSQPAPAMAYGHQQTIAPGCTSCGNAPVSQGYVSQGYAPQPYVQQNCGPAPYAYSAPSIGGGYDQAYGGRVRNRHFGNGLPTGAKPYFFGGGVLIFKRIDDYNRTLSISDTTGAAVLSTRDAAMRTMGGFEIMGGRYFNCGKNAIVASYWGLFPEDQMVARTGAIPANDYRSQLFSPIAANEFLLGPGAPGDSIYTLYDEATTHRLRRSSNYHNVEINLLGFGVGGASRSFNRSTAGTMFSGTRHGRGGYGAGDCGYGDCGSGACGGYASAGACGDCGNYGCGGECCEDATRYATGPCGYVAPGCGSRLNFTWLAGVRYLQFRDNLEYAAIGGAALAGRTLSYDVATTNHLVGFQLGARGDYCMGSRANLYSMAKAGIYGNNASLTSRLGTDADIAYRDGAPATLYNISRSANQLAFLSELGAGVGYRFTPKWSATCGYRAIVASGVATAVGNVRHQGQFISATGIRSQDYLVLHGLNIGALYNF